MDTLKVLNTDSGRATFMSLKSWSNSAARGAVAGFMLMGGVAVANVTWSWLTGEKLTAAAARVTGISVPQVEL